MPTNEDHPKKSEDHPKKSEDRATESRRDEQDEPKLVERGDSKGSKRARFG